MVKCAREQFSLRAFSLRHDEPVDFVLSSWQRSHSVLPMLAVRLVLAAAITAVWLWSFLDDGVSGYWFIYLTNWGLLLLMATTWCGVLVSVTALCVKLPDRDCTPWYLRSYWVLYNIAAVTALLITIFYWAILFDSEVNWSDRSFWLDVCTHAGNSLLMTSELLLSRVPSRLLHFYQPFGFGVWYLVFSGIYYGVGGTDANGNPYVYNVLDWSTPGPTLALVGATAAGVLALHAAVTLVAAARGALSSRLVRLKGHDLPRVPAGIV